MGYYTDFKLQVLEDKIYQPTEDYDEDLKEISGGYYFEDGELYDAKWYNHVTDMLILSKKYKKVTFVLLGEGEERGDFWIKYFKNGKWSERPGSITYAELHPKDKEYYGAP